ncbi:MAG: Mov34/MPN/PAD-1 family protein [Gallionellaceae bacterium]|jgi:integrative and conjugative element protein (TIGR02256 family)
MSEASAEDLRSQRARALINYVRNSVDATFARIDAIWIDGDRDIVDVTLEPQLPQDRAVAIANVEPIRLMFPKADDRAPNIFSLREDFPIGLVHTSFDQGVEGRCLCIWEENWHDLGRTLTPQALVERIRDWFARTAKGELHQPDQPLEPLIPAVSDTLVIPTGSPSAAWHIAYSIKHNESWTVTVDSNPQKGAKAPPFPLFALELPPQVHGALHARPENLETLRQLVDSMGIDFAKTLGEWLAETEQLKANDRRPLILVTIPKLRNASNQVEAWENWAFLPIASLAELGEALGRTFSGEGNTSSLRIISAVPESLNEVVLIGWRVVQRLDRAAARTFSGNAALTDRKLVAVGAGAIGSNVIVNTMRAGVGTWAIIDNDLVLPHNTVRQAQINMMIGHTKAETACYLGNNVLDEEGCKYIAVDFLNPGNEAENVTGALAEADFVIDLSASPSVLGRIADDKTVARAASLFFNPDGNELVVLAEGADRSLRVDEIEAQYFLAAATDPLLEGHLSSAKLDMVRYANACQDLSRPLPPWQVQTLCGIASGRLLTLLESTEHVANAWRLDATTGAVLPVCIPVTGVHRHQFDGWRVTLTYDVLDRMQAFRRRSLPNETGGVLIGSFDTVRAVVHIVAALPAPEDSRQAPTYFIRGSKNLKPLVDGITLRSAGVLCYVGEWHSHPDDAAARPSDDDEVVFDHLIAHIGPTGTPYVMAICGRDETWLRAGWQPHEHEEATVAHARQ